jgi:hypothetical protein
MTIIPAFLFNYYLDPYWGINLTTWLLKNPSEIPSNTNTNKTGIIFG